MSNEKKINKKKGPIRTEAVLPLAIILVVSYIFFRFFFDQSLRKSFEYAGLHIYGAEVNVKSVETSFWNADFVVRGIEFTDKDQLNRNLFSIDKIRFHFVWDALLRAKFVVDVASVEGIEIYSPRKKAGYLLPPKPPEEAAKDAGITGEVAKQGIELAKKEFDNNILGDMAGVMGGVSGSDQLANIQSSLAAENKIKELQSALEEKKKFWNEKFQELSKDQETKIVIDNIKNTKIDTKNVLTAAKSLQELDKNIKKLNEKIKEIDQTQKNLNSDVNKLSSDINSIDGWIKKDVEDLKNRLKIPSLDFQDLSTQLFGQVLYEKFGEYAKYVEVAKEYMPPPKSERNAVEKIVPRKRGEGVNFKFPLKNSYPKFWLKEAKISSKESDSGFSGNLQGQILDITNNPALIGKPSLILLKGDFPKFQILGIDSKITIDNTNEESLINVDSKIASFPVEKRVLSNSPSLKMGMNSASGSSHLTGQFKNARAEFKLNNEFQNIDFYLEAEKPDVKSLVENVLSDLKKVEVNANIAGAWGKLRIGVNSNIGKALSDGFKRELQKKIDDMNEKINRQVRDKVEAEKKKLEAEFKKVKSQFDEQIAKNTEGIKKAQKDAQAKIDEQKKAGKQQEKKVLDDLKKKFKL